jgi:hypothetical protein
MNDSDRDQGKERKLKAAPAAGATEPRFKFECPRTSDSLEPTKEPSVRHCEDCDKPVYLSRSVPEAEANSREARCVALAMPAPPRRGLVLRTWDAVIAAVRALSRGRSPLPLEANPDAPPLSPPPKVTRMGCSSWESMTAHQTSAGWFLSTVLAAARSFSCETTSRLSEAMRQRRFASAEKASRLSTAESASHRSDSSSSMPARRTARAWAATRRQV